MKSVFMFPGQGSQAVGMMSELLAESAVAQEVFAEASSAINIDLTKAALEGPESFINQTAITQPLVLTSSIAMWREWQRQSDFRPDYLCGHSLGEYSAMIASEVLGLADTVKLVHLRGELMQEAVPMGEGGMAALLGLDDKSAQKLCEQAAQGEVVSAANYNSPGQIVISGSRAALERAIDLAKAEGARRATLLPVSVPCHCSLLEPAGKALAESMAKLDFNEPVIPIVQNVDARIPESLEALRANLLAHLYQPVRWSDSIGYLIELGADTFVECGPGKVLAGLNRRIDKNVTTLVMNDLQTLMAARDVLQKDESESA